MEKSILVHEIHIAVSERREFHLDVSVSELSTLWTHQTYNEI